MQGCTLIAVLTTATDNTISNNSLSDSTYGAASGIQFSNSYACVQSGSRFERNVLTGNSGGHAQSRVLSTPHNQWVIAHNSIHDNPTPYALWYNGASGTTLDAANNWWGTTDVVEIDKQDIGTGTMTSTRAR